MTYSNEEIRCMDSKADEIIKNWTFGALVANLLPPPFDVIVVGGVFAKLGHKIGEVYKIDIKPSVLKGIGKSLAKGIGATVSAAYIGTGLLKYVPGVNIWVALLVQPPMVAAVAYSVGQSFKTYYHLKLSNGSDLSKEELVEIAQKTLKEKVG